MTGVSSGSLVYTYIFKLLGVNNQKVSGFGCQEKEVLNADT